MVASLAFALLLGATLTAERLGRAHRPVALAFWTLLLSAYAATQPLPDILVYASTVTPPAAIVAAAWATLHSRWRPHFSLLLSSAVAGATLIAMAADRFGIFGHIMAYLWVGCGAAGGAALYRGEAPTRTRAVLIALVAGLPVEAVGWAGWRDGVDGPYFFARAINTITLIVIIAIQAGEGVTLPRWATLRALHLERVRLWGRRPRHVEPDTETTKEEPRG